MSTQLNLYNPARCLSAKGVLPNPSHAELTTKVDNVLTATIPQLSNEENSWLGMCG